MREMIDKIAEGRGTRYEINELMRLRGVDAAHRAIAGSGRRPATRSLDSWHKFRPTFERRLLAMEFEPAFDLDAALAPAREIMGRDDADAHIWELRHERDRTTISPIDGSRFPSSPGQTILEAAQAGGHLHPASVPSSRIHPAWQLQALHGDRRRPHRLGVHHARA